MRKTILAAAVTVLAAVPCLAQVQNAPSRYVDHDSAVKMGGVGNYVSKNELKAYESRQDLQSDLKEQLNKPSKTVSLPMNQTVVFFNTGDSQLTPQGKREIGRVADQVKNDRSLVAVIGGFTDSSGPKDLNEKLSKDRAKAVKDELEALGVSSRQIRAEGFGEHQEIASNTTDQGRAMNRRAEIIVENFKSTIG